MNFKELFTSWVNHKTSSELHNLPEIPPNISKPSDDHSALENEIDSLWDDKWETGYIDIYE